MICPHVDLLDESTLHESCRRTYICTSVWKKKGTLTEKKKKSFYDFNILQFNDFCLVSHKVMEVKNFEGMEGNGRTT